MGAGPLVVTYPLTGRSRAIVEEELGGAAETKHPSLKRPIYPVAPQ